MSGNFLSLLLIFGLGHPAREPVDPAKSAPLHSRIPCDGFGSPEDLLRLHATYSAGGSDREFVVSRYHTERCEVDVKWKCLHHEKAGWRDVWSAPNTEPSAQALVPIGACYEWGSNVPAQYVLSGWYQENPPDGKSASKAIWRQVPVKQVSAQPEVYEFADPNGGTARLEITR
jgi:hypothetical protein